MDAPPTYAGTDAQASQPVRGLIREANRAAFLDCFNRVAGTGLSAIAAPGPRAVRIAACWFTTGQSAMMAVHLANYDLEVDTASQSYYVVTVSPSVQHPAVQVKVIAPTPEGWHADARHLDPLPVAGAPAAARHAAGRRRWLHRPRGDRLQHGRG